jgi:DNA repair protein RecO (recombination protein O)
MLRTDEAYLLDSTRLGEADLILTLFAREAGTVRGVARSAKKSRKRFGGALEPMSRVRLSWKEKPGRDLHQVDSMDLLQSFAEMQSDPERQAACALLAEITRTLVGENDPDERFYRLLGAVLEAMRDGLGPFAAVRYFEFWALRIHGMLPDLARCGVCHENWTGREIRLSSPDLEIRCSSCLPDGGAECRVPDIDSWSFLAQAAGAPPLEFVDAEKVCRPGGTLEWFLRRGLETFAEKGFKSYRHLRVRDSNAR